MDRRAPTELSERSAGRHVAGLVDEITAAAEEQADADGILEGRPQLGVPDRARVARNETRTETARQSEPKTFKAVGFLTCPTGLFLGTGSETCSTGDSPS